MSMWGIKGDLQMVELIFDFFKKINFKDWIILVTAVASTVSAVSSSWILVDTELSKTVFDRSFDNFKDRIKNKTIITLTFVWSILFTIVYIVAMLKIYGEGAYILSLLIFLVIATTAYLYFKGVKNNYNKNIAKFFVLSLCIILMLTLIPLPVSDNKKDVKDTVTTSETLEINSDEEANKKIEKASKDSNGRVVIFCAFITVMITIMLIFSLIEHAYRLLDDRKETIYFYDDKGKKIYIYRNLDNGYILCGYRPYMSIDNNNEYYKKLGDVKKTIKKSIKNTITVKDLNKKIDEILNYGRYISMEEIEQKINYISHNIRLKDIDKICKSCNCLLRYCENSFKVKLYSFEDLKDKNLYPMIWKDNK